MNCMLKSTKVNNSSVSAKRLVKIISHPILGHEIIETRCLKAKYFFTS